MISTPSSPSPPAPRLRRQESDRISRYMSPGAIYVAPDLATLDRLLVVLKEDMALPGSLIQRIADIRDLPPPTLRPPNG